LRLGSVLHYLTNVLEDERVENLMARAFRQLRGIFRFLGDLAMEKTSPLPEDDAPWNVLGACLMWRWVHRKKGPEKALKGNLSPVNQKRWEHVRPMVERAWWARDTEEVADIAREILKYLGLPDECPLPDWLRELLEILDKVATAGQRVPGDEPDLVNIEDAPGHGQDDDQGSHPDQEPLGPHLPRGHERGGHLSGVVQPAPYLELEAEAEPLARRLARELEVPDPEARVEAVEVGGRFNFRQECRTPDMPFLDIVTTGPRAPQVAIELGWDGSGSMGQGSDPKIVASRKGVMTLLLACQELGIPLAITRFPGNIVLKEYDDNSELPKALVAGFQGTDGYEKVSWMMEERGKVLEARRERVKLMVIVHDGYPVYQDDPERIVRWIRSHPDVFTLGVYLGDDQDEIQAMRGLFQHLVACCLEEFPTKLGNLIRAVRGGS